MITFLTEIYQDIKIYLHLILLVLAVLIFTLQIYKAIKERNSKHKLIFILLILPTIFMLITELMNFFESYKEEYQPTIIYLKPLFPDNPPRNIINLYTRGLSTSGLIPFGFIDFPKSSIMTPLGPKVPLIFKNIGGYIYVSYENRTLFDEESFISIVDNKCYISPASKNKFQIKYNDNRFEILGPEKCPILKIVFLDGQSLLIQGIFFNQDDNEMCKFVKNYIKINSNYKYLEGETIIGFENVLVIGETLSNHKRPSNLNDLYKIITAAQTINLDYFSYNGEIQE